MSSVTKKTRYLAFYTCILALLVAQQGGRAQASTNALRFFNNFFVTGGHVVGGVGLWNSGSGSITMDLPPDAEGAEVLGAFLYWQVVTSLNPDAVDVNAGATFNGIPLNVPLGSQLAPTPAGQAASNALRACPLTGGTSNSVHTFRADVLSRLDMDASGRRVIEKEGGYPLTMPNVSSRRTIGASLVVIYRHPNPEYPLHAVVINDGTFVKQQPLTLTQQITGFYDPSAVTGKMTYIAGSAQSNLGERLSGPFAQLTNVFDGALGNAWDNVTVTTNALAEGTTAFDTAIAPQSTGILGFLVNDCISMGAMIYETQVNDSDEDGLLNIWESSTSLLLDPNGQPLPLLSEMGALPGTPDAFIEIVALKAAPGTTYGSAAAPLSSTIDSVTSLDGHNHMPTPETLSLLGLEFAEKNVRLHFDVGDPSTYRALLAYPSQNSGDSPYNSSVADAYLVPATHARGGEILDETACEPGVVDHDNDAMTPDVEVDCQFPDFPGTVAWKVGVELYKAKVIDGQRVFDDNRKDTVRFALYAHAKAAPKSFLPCLGEEGQPAGPDATGGCLSGAINPLNHVIAGVSGSGEYPGADFLISLGAWDNTNFVGSPFGVASTSMHEFGHTLGLGHGGLAVPNCKPNYLSVMNYMFQLGGLMDVDGNANLGFSDADLDDLVETSVSDGYSLPGFYRTSWYRPQPEGDSRTPVKRYCNGLKFPEGELAPPPTIRVDGDFSGQIDWNEDPETAFSGELDVNFDGEPDGDAEGPTTTLTGFNDWENIRLNQIGSRRSFAGMSIGPLGVELLADGAELLADGSVLLADGSVLLADGSVLLADGSKLLADGAELLADGSVLLADGVRLLSDGSRLLADGSPLLADGIRLLADGSRLLADGSVLLADGSVLLADGVELLADGAVLLADGVELLADGSMLLADGSPLLADGDTVAWEFTEPTPTSAAEAGTTPGPTELTACQIGEGDCVDPGPNPGSDPDQSRFHRVSLDWEAPALGNVSLYLLYRVVGDTVVLGEEGDPLEVPGSETSWVDEDELPTGVFTYVVEAVLDDEETITPRSNTATVRTVNVPAINLPPVAVPQTVTVWEDFLSAPPITLTGTDADSAGVEAFSVQASSTAGGMVTGTLPDVLYLSAANYNGPDSFTFTVKETSTWNGQNQESEPGTVTLTVMPVNDEPSFTPGANQTVTQPVGAQSVGAWVAGFDAGPPDEDLSQGVLEYVIVSNSNPGIFSSQPAIAADGTLTYTPMAGASGVATVTAQVRDNGGVAEGHGADDLSVTRDFTITILPPPLTIKFYRADMWLSTSSSSRKYDLKAEVMKNGQVLVSKVVTDQTLGFGTTFNKAIYKAIGDFPFTFFNFGPTDALSLRVSMKVSSSSSGGNNASGAIRLWYNVPTTPSSQTKDSHLHAKRNGTDVRYYLITPSALQLNGTVAGPTQSIDAVVYKTAYTVLGTWSVTGP